MNRLLVAGRSARFEIGASRLMIGAIRMRACTTANPVSSRPFVSSNSVAR